MIARLRTFDASAYSQLYYTALIHPLSLKMGMSVLDVGCRLGRRTAAMCYQVGRSGTVVGADDSSAVVSFARNNQGYERQKVLGWVIQEPSSSMPSIDCTGCRLKGDAAVPRFDELSSLSELPYPRGSFDGVIGDGVLQRVENEPLRVVKELARVTRQSGRVVLGFVSDEDAPDGILISSSIGGHDELQRQAADLLFAAGLGVEHVGAVPLPFGAEEEHGSVMMTCVGRVPSSS